MTRWQRRARWLIALFALAVAVLVGTQLKRRAPATQSVSLPKTDGQAVSQTDRGRTRRFSSQNEDISIEYEKAINYADGSSVLQGLKVFPKPTDGRTFTVTADEGRSANNEGDLTLTGDVVVTSSDGIVVKTDHAVYTAADGIVRADGPVTFSRGSMSGSGVGATYDKNRDVLSVLDKATVRMPADQEGKGQLDVDAASAEFVRADHIVKFDRGLKARQQSGLIEADSAVAHLDATEEHLERLELRGRARITGDSAEPGGLKSLSGSEIDLAYAASSLQKAAVRGSAVADVYGDRGQASRQISASTLDLTLAADGATPIGLTARSGVKLTLPASKEDPARTVTADALDAVGKEGQGLTGGHFTGNVQLVERATDVARTARAAVLDADMSRGLGTIEEARFSKSVRFEQADLTATSAAARYVLAKGTLELSGSEPGSVTPRIVNERMDTAAPRIDVTLEGPVVHAQGGVQSTLRASRPTDKDRPKVPAMLDSDQDVSVTANDLRYDGKTSQARYSGNAVLFQGETKVKGAWVNVDDKSGDLTAGGGVTTTTFVKEEGADGKVERVKSTGTGTDFKYEDSLRKATYTTDAHMVGPQGDVHADVIALFLKDSGDEIDRAEAHGHVVVVDDKKRTSKGDELKYFSADDRYEMAGKPVLIVDQCGRPTDGLTLTFYRANDRIILNGTPQNLTRTRSDGSACS
ncbi:MAG TPA: LPS export ABC transporter periplasmic protein LptC [Vicinamibacterales bacterium]|nr:LPS export ABC transporter periplasmic protein LptC [Vicinamibacterales bacterium]